MKSNVSASTFQIVTCDSHKYYTHKHLVLKNGNLSSSINYVNKIEEGRGLINLDNS